MTPKDLMTATHTPKRCGLLPRADDYMPTDGAASFNNVRVVPKAYPVFGYAFSTVARIKDAMSSTASSPAATA